MTNKKIIGINEIVDRLERLEEKPMPTLKYYMELELYFSDFKSALDVIRKYQDNSKTWEPTELVQDAIYLQAIHARLSPIVGYVQGMSSRAENSRKLTRAQYALDIKKKRDSIYEDTGEFVKLTEKETDDASRVLSASESIRARDTEVISRMLTSGWHAVGDFTHTLKTAINRANKEQMLG
jgi:hypothetical protein